MIKYLDELNKLLLEFKIINYVIVGSGVLAILNIRENQDLDILIDEKTFLKLKKKYSLNEQKGIDIGNIEICNPSNPWFENQNLLIKNGDIINGFRFMKLKDLIDWKKKMGRDKDLRDLELINNFLKKT